MKFQVNCEWGQNKARQNLYKEVPINTDLSLEQRQFEVIQKPNIRIYCWSCQLDITRHPYVLTKGEYYCIVCFSNVEEYPQDYLVKSSLRRSFNQTSWSVMDEVVMTTAFKLWGFGNWSQIKEYMDYNASPFRIEEIQSHFQQYYLNCNNHMPTIQPFTDTLPKSTYGNLALSGYAISLKSKVAELRRKDSKGQKKPQSMKSLSMISSSRDIDIQKQANKNEEQSQQHHPEQSIRKQIKNHQRYESNILGYNAKRKQFQLGEYDYTAECMLSQLQFYDSDTVEEYKLKLQIIEHYNRRLDERLKRREFVVEYKLLDSHYHFNHKNQVNQDIGRLMQPFMRYTRNHEEYRGIIQSYSLLKKYQKYLINLTKIREKVDSSATVETSYKFMKRKRDKYIDNWEKTFHKKFNDRQRKVSVMQREQDGSQHLQLVSGEEQLDLIVPRELWNLDNLQQMKENQVYKRGAFNLTKLTSVAVQKSKPAIQKINYQKQPSVVEEGDESEAMFGEEERVKEGGDASEGEVGEVRENVGQQDGENERQEDGANEGQEDGEDVREEDIREDEEDIREDEESEQQKQEQLQIDEVLQMPVLIELAEPQQQQNKVPTLQQANEMIEQSQQQQLQVIPIPIEIPLPPNHPQQLTPPND